VKICDFDVINAPQKSINEGKERSEITNYCSLTKGGVDSLDEKCAGHRTRWSMAIFYRILDVSGENAFILYNSY
jgi:hypothetical protein